MFNRRWVRLYLSVACTAGSRLLRRATFSTRIRERTGARANLMAIACDEIIRQLAPDARTVTSADVETALESEAIHAALQGWQSLSGVSAEEANRVDRMVVYSKPPAPETIVPMDQRPIMHSLSNWTTRWGPTRIINP